MPAAGDSSPRHGSHRFLERRPLGSHSWLFAIASHSRDAADLAPVPQPAADHNIRPGATAWRRERCERGVARRNRRVGPGLVDVLPVSRGIFGRVESFTT